VSGLHVSRAEQLLDIAPVGIHHTDAAGTCTFVNERWSAISGISRAAALGRSWIDAVHDGDRSPLLAQWLETVARGLEFACDVRVGGHDGPARQVTIRSVPVLSSTGAVTGHVAAVTELPDRRHDRVRQLIVDNLTDVVLVFDMRRELLYATPSFETLTGRRSDDAACHVHEGLGVHPDDAPRMRSFWAGLWDGEGYLGAEFRIVMADGVERWCTSAGAPVLDGDGGQVGVQIRHADVTRRKQIEERVRQSEERARPVAVGNILDL
jgi:PAS domain S-box-containing protein